MTRLTDAELRHLLANNPHLALVTDGSYTTAAPTPAAQQVVQAGVHDERSLQAAVIAACDERALTDDRWGDIYAVPNGQYRPGQRMEPGLRKGVPDLFVAVPSGVWHGMYIELKWGANDLSREQMEWMQRLRKRGYHCVMIRNNVATVIEAIATYLGGQ